MTAATAPRAGGGRGARERILRTAADLFHAQGVTTTGIDQLAATASVSKRTLYKHFATKDALVEAYLRRFEEERLIERESVLDREDLAPRERLLAIFDLPADLGARASRGCPFANAAVEFAALDHPVHRVADEHKRRFRARLAEVAAEAGVHDPALVAAQLALLSDGLSSHLVVAGGPEGAADAARAAAATLLG